MNVSRTDSGDITIIRVEGEIVLEFLHEVKRMFQEVLLDGRRLVIVNLGGVSSFGSSAVGAIMSLASELRKDNGKLALAPVAPVANHALELLRLRDRFQIFNSEEDAIAYMNA